MPFDDRTPDGGFIGVTLIVLILVAVGFACWCFVRLVASWITL